MKDRTCTFELRYIVSNSVTNFDAKLRVLGSLIFDLVDLAFSFLETDTKAEPTTLTHSTVK